MNDWYSGLLSTFSVVEKHETYWKNTIQFNSIPGVAENQHTLQLIKAMR